MSATILQVLLAVSLGTSSLAYKSPAVVTGFVSDSVSGSPIVRFNVIGATNDPDYSSDWGWARCTGENGRYKLTFDRAFQTHRVRVEAPGYRPVNSDLITSSDGRYVFDTELSPAADLRGHVVSREGVPLTDARVMVVTPTSGFITITDDLENDNGGYYRETKTDAAGAFTSPAECEVYDVLVLHDSGHARVTSESFEHDSTIRLTPWSRIEGQVRDASDVPIAGAEVILQDTFAAPGHAAIGYWPHSVTGGDGRYAIGHVPAGEHAVVLVKTGVESAERGFHCKTVTTSAQHACELNFGGNGSNAVLGRVIFPPDQKDCGVAWPRLTRIDHPARTVPTTVPSSRADHWTAGASENHHFQIRSEGNFWIDSVSPGEYQLTINAFVVSSGTATVVATLSQRVTVGGEPLDLGELQLVKKK